jgi:cyclohexa-1,5-dienecarbonyl-CoA hydratase
MAPKPTTVRYELLNGVARITLDRPPLNVLDQAMLDDLAAVVMAIRDEPKAKCLLLTGAGKAFCAGVDVKDHTANRVERMLHTFHDAIKGLLACEMPVICAVQGAALGGGMELALACDVVLARDDAKFAQPEIKLGVFPPAAAVLLWRLVGRQRALDLILSGRTIDATEARAIGLVSTVFAADKFASGVDEYAAHLASLSAPVLKLAKRAVNDGLHTASGAALMHAERLYLRDLMELADPQEGLAAWAAKRPPVWRDE